jgi:hypothetical protein
MFDTRIIVLDCSMHGVACLLARLHFVEPLLLRSILVLRHHDIWL